ncbi:hypothetical protein [Pseudanabaena sp. PCC 6802]|nr:hypothetical protein [Pseudanabaena sp. PCC 6802]
MKTTNYDRELLNETEVEPAAAKSVDRLFCAAIVLNDWFGTDLYLLAAD